MPKSKTRCVSVCLRVFGGDWALRIIRFSKFEKQWKAEVLETAKTQKMEKKFFEIFSLTTPPDFNLAIFRPETVFVAYIGNIEAKNGWGKSWPKVTETRQKADQNPFMID